MDIIRSRNEYDVIVENQRGMTLMGYPFFSPKLLFPRFDPSNFQILNSEKGTLNDIRGSRRSIKDVFPLEGEDEGGRWFVDMGYDGVDDQGWIYSWSFTHGRWRGRKGLVRRRIWIRQQMEPISPMHGRRIEQGYSCPMKRQKEEEREEDNEPFTLIALLQKQLLDRHKFEVLKECDKSLFQDATLRKRTEECFQYTSSKHKFQEWLKQK